MKKKVIYEILKRTLQKDLLNEENISERCDFWLVALPTYAQEQSSSSNGGSAGGASGGAAGAGAGAGCWSSWRNSCSSAAAAAAIVAAVVVAATQDDDMTTTQISRPT